MIFAGLGGGGGSSRQGPREPIMTKEAMMEDLVKRSADSSSGSQASAVNSGTGGAEPVWQEAGGGFDIDLGKKFTSRQYTMKIFLDNSGMHKINANQKNIKDIEYIEIKRQKKHEKYCNSNIKAFYFRRYPLETLPVM